MKQNDLLAQWLAEEQAAHIHGWDFSHIRGRYQEEDILPWDYGRMVRQYLQPESRILDIDTGGGEFLLSLGHPYALTAAAEGYPPNADLCRRTLLPLGIDFREADGGGPLPFPDRSFDLILNRHGDYDPWEIFRLLRPGGVPLEELQAVLGEVEVDPAVVRPLGDGEQPRAPGMKYRHYAPKAPVTVVRGDPMRSAQYILDHIADSYWEGVICFNEFAHWFEDHPVEQLGGSLDRFEHARRLFRALRAMDENGVKHIWAQCPDTDGMGLAVVNRLNKASGFHIVDA